MKKAALLSLSIAAALLVPGFAVAEEIASPAVTAAPTEAPPCGDLAGLDAATPAQPAAPDLTPLEDAVLAQGGPNCCAIAERQCRQTCRATGVFEFSCDPTTCSSSCICNIGP